MVQVDVGVVSESPLSHWPKGTSTLKKNFIARVSKIGLHLKSRHVCCYMRVSKI